MKKKNFSKDTYKLIKIGKRYGESLYQGNFFLTQVQYTQSIENLNGKSRVRVVNLLCTRRRLLRTVDFMQIYIEKVSDLRLHC